MHSAVGFRLADYTRVRPFAFHLTARSNLAILQQTRRLETAAALMKRASRLDLLDVRRTGPVTIEVDGRSVLLRDQSPLHEGNILFEGGWTLATLIEELNSRVFFWPGTDKGPIDYGQRHFERYEGEPLIVLRVPTEDLVASNAALEPQFCPFNSGAPRTNNGKGSPRGPKLFLGADRFERAPSEVIELTFRGSVTLPDSCEWAESYGAAWRTIGGG